MSQLEDFRNEFLEVDLEIERYKKLYQLTQNRMVFVYFISTIIGLLLGLVSEVILSSQTASYGTEGDRAWAIIIFAVLVALVLFRLLRQRKADYGYEPNDVSLHYLASALEEYQSNKDSEKVTMYLNRFEDFSGINDRPILSPKRQVEFIQYIQAISEEDTSVREKILDDTFEENMETVVSEIRIQRNEKINMPDTRDRDETSQIPSTVVIVSQELWKSMSYGRIKLASGLAILIMAGLGQIIIGQGAAVAILAAFPVLQYILPVFGNPDQEN